MHELSLYLSLQQSSKRNQENRHELMNKKTKEKNSNFVSHTCSQSNTDPFLKISGSSL